MKEKKEEPISDIKHKNRCLKVPKSNLKYVKVLKSDIKLPESTLIYLKEPRSSFKNAKSIQNCLCLAIHGRPLVGQSR